MPDQTRTTRRGLLGYAGAGGLGLATGAIAATQLETPASAGPQPTVPGTISPFGTHQPGVTAPTPRANRIVALDVHDDLDAAALGRLMRLWSGSIAAATQGRPAPGDTARDLAQGNVDLSVVVGWGYALFDKVGLADARPPALVRIPAFDHDRLQQRWSGGDLMVMVGAADDTTVTHTLRRLLLDAEPFATLRWEQDGSWRGLDSHQAPTTGRNLFGQVDGTGNLLPDDPLFDATVWTKTPDWFAGGTTMVVRRISMDLDTWDTLTRAEQEASVGRDLDVGAPLTGAAERDLPDFDATEDGRPVIASDAHMRLSHPQQNGGRRILRRGLNYTTYDPETGGRDSGLVFCSFQADLGDQFVPIQRRLDRGDALNEWTTAIGSAEFAILPGFAEDGWLGDTLLT
ncbi:Dyp-type peroxidase [Nocardioides sp.]|uniref:Dyp-type peroxidase n=1 Tax=Nocardioides sp. TaxID=35761 RepID=UPI003526CFCF